MSVERIIGIDFGTSTSLVKVKSYRDGQPVDGDPTSTQAVEFDNGRVTTPTLIRFAGGAEYYGQDAVSPKLDSTLCKNFKLDLQSPDPAAKAQAQELTRKFFRFLYEQYSWQSTRFGQFDAERTLVSYPAKWKPETREFMLQAARDAGFQHVSGMDEPTAALYTVMVQESARLVQQGYLTAGKPAYVLMIDMGAGTTDLALCRYTPGGQNRIIDTWPPAESKVLFGGREMDELLIRYLVDYLKRCGTPEKMVANVEKNNLEDCKAWKENSVSSALARGAAADECAFVTSMLMWAGGIAAPFPAIDRAVLEDYCRDYIGRYAELIAGAMAHARQVAPEFDAGDLTLAVLTGGHSQWYFAKDMLCCTLPGYEGGVGVRLSANQVVTLKPPQHTVSSGLVFSVQDVAPAEQPQAEPQPTPQQEQRRQQAHSRPTPPTPQPELKQKQQTYTYTTSSSTAQQTAPPKNSGFDILLKSPGANGIAVLKAVRDITGLELGDAKRIVDSAPGVVKSGVSKEEAETIKNRLAGLGATVEVFPGQIRSSTPHPESSPKDSADFMVMPIEDLMSAANEGDPYAQYALADRYQNGEDVPEDHSQADFWFKQAYPKFLELAEQGDPSVQHDLAGMFYFAQGIERNYTEAAKWYQRAADQGFSPAQRMLGKMYENGHGVDKDIYTAIMWFKKAGAKEDINRLKPGGKSGFLKGLFK